MFFCKCVKADEGHAIEVQGVNFDIWIQRKREKKHLSSIKDWKINLSKFL